MLAAIVTWRGMIVDRNDRTLLINAKTYINAKRTYLWTEYILNFHTLLQESIVHKPFELIVIMRKVLQFIKFNSINFIQ